MPTGLFPGAEHPATLEGVLERITYINEENAWSVVKITLPGRADPVTAVGNLLGAQPGESLRLTGRWTTDRKYGRQFKVDSYVTIHPATLVGIQKYLSSGLVRGIGSVMAERLVKRFGMSTLEVIDTTPERLAEVEGIGPVRTARIREAWAEQRGIKEVMIFLQSLGISTNYAIKIYKQYGERAIGLVKDDPYRLATEIFGIGFKTADRIAANLGIPKDSPRRAQAGVLHLLGELSSEGHVFSPHVQLAHEASEMLEIDPARVAAAIEEMGASGLIVVEGPAGVDIQRTAIDRAGERIQSPGKPAVPRGADGENVAVYLKSLHVAESVLAARLRALTRAPVRPFAIDPERALAWFESHQGIRLAEQQREAIRRAFFAKVLVVTGGPGTGKTTLVNGVIRILEKKARRILLAAPTGRAAKRLEEATGREAKTLHRLLEFNPRTGKFQRDRGHPLEADLVVVDEASMLDVVLAFHLVIAIPDACQLVLVGDIDQIPSVGPGSVLRDLIRSEAVDVVRLSEIFRQAEKSLIVVSAHRVNRGEMPITDGGRAAGMDTDPGGAGGLDERSRATGVGTDPGHASGASSKPRSAPGVGTAAVTGFGGPANQAEGEQSPGESGRDFYFVEKTEPEDVLAAVKSLVAQRIPRRFGLDAFEEIQVLTPMHRGLLGAANLNAELQALLNPSGEALVRGSRSFRAGDKVMQIRNNYDLEVFNGDIGRIASIDEAGRRVHVRYDDRSVAYDYADLDELVLSYACSIHKAQGSEYPCVVIPLHTQHYVMLQRNLLYTAITRGKRLVVLVGSRRALAIAVRNARVSERHTRLADRLRGM